MAEEWGHPTGDDVERFLARQFVENFMISRFVDEVYSDDKDLYKRVMGILRDQHVDEHALRDEAREQIKNIPEGTVDYEIALSKALKEVKKRHGLIQPRQHCFHVSHRLRSRWCTIVKLSQRCKPKMLCLKRRSQTLPAGIAGPSERF